MGLARLADVGWGNEGRVFTSGFPRAAPLRAGGSRRDMRAIPQQLITVLGPRPAFPSHPGRQRCADADVVPSVHDSSFVQRRCRQMLDARYLYATSPPPSNPHARLSHHHCAAHGQSVGSQSANNAHGQQSSGGTITRAWCCRSPPPVLKRGRGEGRKGRGDKCGGDNGGDSPVTRYSSKPSIVAMSASSIANPPISAFSLILSFRTLFGSGT